MSIFITGGCLVATLKYHVTTPGIHNQKIYPTKNGFFFNCVYQWVGSFVGAQGCKFVGKGQKQQNYEPSSSCNDALTLGTPSSLGVTTCKTLQDFFLHTPPLFSSDTPSGVTRGEMKNKNKNRGWVFKKTKCPPFLRKKHPVYKVTSDYPTKVDTVKFTLNRGSGD